MRSVIRFIKRPQVSLLGLLLLITASALLIQFVIIPAYQRSARKSILTRIDQLKGQWFDLNKQPLQRRLLLQGDQVNDQFLHKLADVVHLVPELKQLDLLQTEVTDEGWQDLLSRRSAIDHYIVFENSISKSMLAQSRIDYPAVTIEERRPDPIAVGLSKAPIPPAAIISLVHNATSGELLFGSGDGRLHRMEIESESSRTSLRKHRDWVFDLSIAPSKRWVATGGGDNQVCIHRMNDLQTIATGEAHTEDVHGVVWMNDQQLVSVGDDRTLRLWDFSPDSEANAPNLKAIAMVPAHKKPIPRLKRLNDHHVLTLSRDHSLKRWEVTPDGFELRSEFNGHDDDCMDASVSPDGKEIASVGYDGKLILWNTDGTSKIQYQVANERLFAIHVDWSLYRAVVGSKSGVHLIDLESGRLLRKNGNQRFVSRIIQADGKLFTSDGFGQIYERNPATLSSTRHFQLFEGSLDVYSSEGLESTTSNRSPMPEFRSAWLYFRSIDRSRERCLL